MSSNEYQVLDVQSSSVDVADPDLDPATQEVSLITPSRRASAALNDPPPPPVALTNLTFQTVVGQRFLVRVEQNKLPETTVAQLKLLLEQTHSIPVNHQRVIFSGRELLDHETAASCHIEGESVLQLVLRAAPAEQILQQVDVAVAEVPGASLPQVQQAQLHWQARTVFIFAVLDIIYGVTSIRQSELYIVVALAGFVGCYGARYYSVGKLRLYWLGALWEIGLSIYQATQVDSTIWIFYLIAALVEVYVVTLICRLCVLIRSCSEQQRIAAQAGFLLR